MRNFHTISVFPLGMICFFLCGNLHAQENGQVVIHGRKYIEINMHSLNRYSKRLERTQTSLLKKLKQKEERMAHRLKRTDSVGYGRLQAQSLSFDSILQLSRHPDSATLAAKAIKGGQKSIDSLKGIYQFIQGKAGGLARTNVSEGNGFSQQLDDLKRRLAYQQYISELTQEHTKNLENIAGGKHGITGIQKELFYAKSKITEWKKLADEPSKAEELALEYLQGTKGFDGAMKSAMSNRPGNSMSSATSAEDLEAMGFQTKRMMNEALKKTFGNNLSAVQGNIGKDVKQWQDQATSLQKDLNETGQNLKGIRHTARPQFIVNPMRGMPLLKRIERQYSFSSQRSNTLTDGTKRPAILSLSASVAYKYRPKLSSGIGIAGDMGLGENWSWIRFSFEGIGVRTFINWELIYGIGAYAGLERTYKLSALNIADNDPSNASGSVRNGQNYRDAILIGASKRYKINSKWNGQIQVLYDAFWKDNNLRSPLVIRFININ
jgi:hypothetical protein